MNGIPFEVLGWEIKPDSSSAADHSIAVTFAGEYLTCFLWAGDIFDGFL
jgi:hypothetical protein